LLLAKELATDQTLIGEWKGWRLAAEFINSLRQKIRIDLRTLQNSLHQFDLARIP